MDISFRKVKGDNMGQLQSVNNKDEAKLAYKRLKEEYQCTIWVQKIEFVDPKEEFKEA